MKNLLIGFVLFLSLHAYVNAAEPVDIRLRTSLTAEASSPPLEYFSLNTLFLRNKIIVHIGHDLINQNYVVFPSPNLQSVKKMPNGKHRVTIQQYYPELERRILDEYKILSSKLHYVYITSYEVFDQNGALIDRIIVPEGVQYRPPQFYQLEVNEDVKVLSFVFGFSGRTAWSDSGTSSDLQAVYRDLRAIQVDQQAAIRIETPSASGLKAYEVLTSHENVRVSQILSNFQFITAWGRFAEKDDFLKDLVSMKNFQSVSIDLSKGVEDLKRYPDIFGNPLDPKWTSVIHQIKSQKLTEKEHKSDDAISTKFGLDKVFNFGGDGSKKRESRFKEMIQWEAQGDFYVPKSIDFVLRADNTFSLLNDMVLQVFGRIEEGRFRYGSGLSLSEVRDQPSLGLEPLPFTPESGIGKPVAALCQENAVMTSFKSFYERRAFDRKFQHQCSMLSEFGSPLLQMACSDTPLSAPNQGFSFECGEDSFLTGERSVYGGKERDRKYNYRCCAFGTANIKKVKKTQCQWSSWVNEPFSTLSYSCPSGAQMAGVQSEYVRQKHHGHTIGSDRKFRFQCCDMEASSF